MRRRLLLAIPLAVPLVPMALPLASGGCALLRRRTPHAASPAVHAVLGPPYRLGGIWRYPRPSYDADETGLAVVLGGPARLAADGAPWDVAALMGAHPTLQLPSVVRVTNLETGRQILLRLDDRGPEQPSRLLAMTPRAAVLLGPSSQPGVWRLRLRVEDEPSRRLTARLGGPDAPALAIAAAPVGAVLAEDLPPPPGARGRAMSTPEPAAPVVQAGIVQDVPLRLPEAIVQLPVRATELWIDAGGVGHRPAAELLRARLGGLDAVVVNSPLARPEVAWRVRIGPLPDVAAADRMLDRVLNAGVVDARIIVQ